MLAMGRLAADPGFIVFARFAVIAFFAIVFLQSGLNKVFDSEGNLGFMREHFQGAPLLANNAGALFWSLTVLELLAGVFCGLGLITFSFVSGGFFARWGLRLLRGRLARPAQLRDSLVAARHGATPRRTATCRARRGSSRSSGAPR